MFESRIGGRYNQRSAEEVNMSIAAGIVTSITTACTLVWCTVGDRIAAVPAVGRVIAYVDGGHNIPSDAQVDALMAEARRRTAPTACVTATSSCPASSRRPTASRSHLR